LWNKYKKWYIAFRKNHNYTDYLKKHWIQPHNNYLKWTEQKHYDFFEKNILPKCKDNIMLSKKKICSCWEKYTNWYTKFIKFDYKKRYSTFREFLNYYKLKQPYYFFWEEKDYFDFFEKNILPKCKDNIMLGTKQIKSMWYEYKSWMDSFNRKKFPNKFKTHKDFLKIYWLKRFSPLRAKYSQAWDNKKTFLLFFEENILPKCKNNVMLRHEEVSKMWPIYKSWVNCLYYNKFEPKLHWMKDIMKLYNLQKSTKKRNGLKNIFFISLKKISYLSVKMVKCYHYQN